MKPWTTVATAPGGYALKRRGDEYLLLVEGKVLMSSRAHESEAALGRVGCTGLGDGARVLVGGLGFGFTLRAALDTLPASARVTVAERSPAVVAWSRGLLASLAADPLDDARVTVDERDVARILSRSRGAFDAVLLDVDNGPVGMAAPGNQALYDAAGLATAWAALAKGGRLALWSAGADGRFERTLQRQGLAVRREPAGGRHLIYVVSETTPR